MTLAVRLARQELGVGVFDWLKLRLSDLNEYIEIINNENERINKEYAKNSRKRK